jgi:hypothetical protein
MTDVVAQPAKPLRSTVFTNREVFLTVIVLSLPIAGALYREMAFAINGRIPLGVGAAMPLPTLVVVAIQALLPGFILGAWIAWYKGRLSRSEGDVRIDAASLSSVPEPSGRTGGPLSNRAGRLTFAIFAIAITVWIGAAVILGAKGIGTVVMLITASVLGWYADRLIPPESAHVPLARTAVVALAVTALLTTTSALGPTTAGTYVANVRFVAGSGVGDGTYSMLGDDGTTTWLLGCRPNSSAVRVQGALVASMTVVPFGPPPDLLSVASGPNLFTPAGFVQRCPS